jgi:hypothetical protein
LESGRTIGQPKEHDERLEQTPVRPEGSLPFVTFFYPNIIETPADVELGKVTGPLKLVNQLRD